LELKSNFFRYKKNGKNSFKVEVKGEVSFGDIEYSIGMDGQPDSLQVNSYIDKLSKEQSEVLLNAYGSIITNKIKRQLQVK